MDRMEGGLTCVTKLIRLWVGVFTPYTIASINFNTNYASKLKTKQKKKCFDKKRVLNLTNQSLIENLKEKCCNIDLRL